MYQWQHAFSDLILLGRAALTQVHVRQTGLHVNPFRTR